ncbi:MAG: oligosaccharide flippase family protein [Actinobacteria bacterium]|nr:oligosaccharide flippase family protein [Actinomycetota bacterium]
MTPSASPGTLSRTVIRGVGVIGGGQMVTQALTFALYIVLARLAPPHTFGTFAAASVLVTLSSLLVESGMSATLIHRRDRLEEATSTALAATATAGVLFSLLSLAAAPLIGWYFGSREIGEIALASSGTHLVTSLGVVPNALLQRNFAFARRTLVEPGAVIALGVGSVAGLLLGYGAWGLLLGAYASAVTRVSLLWMLCRWRPTLRHATFSMWRELSGYARHILAAEMLREGNRVTTTALIGRFIGTSSLGQYNFGARIATQTNALFVLTGASVLFPAFSRISHEEERFRLAFLRALRAICMIAIPASLVFLGIGEQFVVIALGERWRVAGHVLMALSFIGVGGALGSVGAEAFKAAGRPQLAWRAQALSLATTLAFVGILLPFGVVAVAVGTSASFVAVGVFAIDAARRVLGLRAADVFRELWPPVIAGLGGAGVSFAADHWLLHAASRATSVGLGLLVVELLLAVATYLVVLTVLAPGRLGDLTSALRGRP